MEEYGPNIEYIWGNENIAAGMLARLSNIINQDNIHESTYTTETTLELYDNGKIQDGTSSITLQNS